MSLYYVGGNKRIRGAHILLVSTFNSSVIFKAKFKLIQIPDIHKFEPMKS